MSNPSTQNVGARKPMVGGGVYYVAGSTPLPTDATAELPEDILAGALGYISEEGIQPTRETNVEKIKAWGGDIVAALLSDESASFEFTLLETFRKNVAEFVYSKDNVTFTPAAAGAPSKVDIIDKGGKPEQGVFVFDMKHGKKRERVIVPVGDPVITGEEPWTDSGLSAYTVEVEAIKDADGARIYRYMENDDALPAGG